MANQDGSIEMVLPLKLEHQRQMAEGEESEEEERREGGGGGEDANNGHQRATGALAPWRVAEAFVCSSRLRSREGYRERGGGKEKEGGKDNGEAAGWYNHR